jgi:hypothetical protein
MMIGWMDHTVAQGTSGNPMPCISETDGMSWNHEKGAHLRRSDPSMESRMSTKGGTAGGLVGILHKLPP